MRMNPKAMEAVLRALQKNCLDDMADDKSSPKEKMADAIEDSGDEYAEDDDEDTESPEEKMAEESDPGMEEDEDEMSKLRKFFKSPPPVKPRPGTAIMMAVEEHPRKKKSIKDLMNG